MQGRPSLAANINTALTRQPWLARCTRTTNVALHESIAPTLIAYRNRITVTKQYTQEFAIEPNPQPAWSSYRDRNEALIEFAMYATNSQSMTLTEFAVTVEQIRIEGESQPMALTDAGKISQPAAITESAVERNRIKSFAPDGSNRICSGTQPNRRFRNRWL